MVLRPSAVSRHKISARPSPSKSPAPATVHENLLTPVVSCCVLALPDNQIALRPSAVSRHKISVDPSPLKSPIPTTFRSEEHTSELQSLMRNSYAVFCLKKKKYNK